MEYISFYFLQVMDFMVYGVVAYALYDDQIKINKYIHLLLYSVFSFVIMFFYIFNYQFFETVYLFCIISYLLVILEGNILKRFRMMFTILMIAVSVQSSIMLFFKKQTSFSYELNLLSVSIVIVMLSIAGIIYLIRKKKKNFLDWNDIPLYVYLNILICFFGAFFPLFFVSSQKEHLTPRLNIAITVVSYLVAICSAITIVLYLKNYNERNKYFNENQIKEQLLEMQKKYYFDLVKNYEDVRTFKHDFQGHMRVIKTLEENNNYNELRSYVTNIQSEMRKSSSFQCNNIYISAVVNSFVLDCQENRILLDISFEVMGNITVNNVHLCSLLHNLLSNAVEEQQKNDALDEKTISLRITNYSTALIIDLTNNVSKDFNLDSINLKKTSKNDSKNHGIGLYNIYNIVDIYNGNAEYSCKEKKLSTNIVLLNCVEES